MPLVPSKPCVARTPIPHSLHRSSKPCVAPTHLPHSLHRSSKPCVAPTHLSHFHHRSSKPCATPTHYPQFVSCSCQTVCSTNPPPPVCAFKWCATLTHDP